MMRSEGARPAQPRYPSPCCTVTWPYPSSASSAAADRASSGTISIVYTCWASHASTAAWYPEPVPISNTLCPLPGSSSSVINASMNGCEIAAPCPIGNGVSSQACARSSAGTNRCRGVSRMTRSTSASRIPRASICSRTILSRSAANGSAASHRSATANAPRKRPARWRRACPPRCRSTPTSRAPISKWTGCSQATRRPLSGLRRASTNEAAVCVDGNALEAPFRRVPDTLALVQSRLLRDLAEDPEQIAAQKFPDALIGIPSTPHCVRNHREIADVAHPARQRRPAIEIAAERDVVLADQPYGAVDHAHPLVHGHADFIRDSGRDHWELRRNNLVELSDAHLRAARHNARRVPKWLAGVLCAPLEGSSVVQLVAKLEPDHAALGRKLFQQPIRHVPWNVVHSAQAVVSCNHRVAARIDSLRDRVIGSMRHIDHHPEPIHLVNEGDPPFIQPVPLCGRAAVIRIVAGPVMRRELNGPKPQPVHLAQNAQVAIQVEAALDIKHCCDPAALVNLFNIGRRPRNCDRCAVPPDLLERAIQHAQCLFGLQTRRIVVFRDEDGEEECAQPTLLGARQIELAVGLPAADIAAVIELAVDRMHMAVEHQRTRVQRAPPISGLAKQPQGRRQQTCRQLIIVGAWFSSHEQLLSPQTGRRRNHLFQVLACAAHRGSLPRWLRVERRSPLSSHGLGVAIRRSGRAERSQPGTCEPAPYDEDLPLDCGSADAWRLEACRGWCGARRRARQLPA